MLVVGFGVMAVAAAATADPSWTDVWTAFGTVGAVVAAVGIAVWSQRRSDKLVRAEHRRADQQMAEERAHSAAQIEEERQLTREREQLAEAYAVQVVSAEQVIKSLDDSGDCKKLAVMVVNRGGFTITRIEAQFSPDGASLISHFVYKRLQGFPSVPEELRVTWREPDERALYGVLTPWDLGTRFETDMIHVKNLKSPYPLVRWTDQWGSRWEHRRGNVRQLRDDEQWMP